MAKFSKENPLQKSGTGAPAGIGSSGNFFSQARSLVKEVKDLFQFVQEARGLSNQDQGFNAGGGQRDKALPSGPNPAVAKFMAKFGDKKVSEILEIIGPLTIRELIELMKSGT